MTKDEIIAQFTKHDRIEVAADDDLDLEVWVLTQSGTARGLLLAEWIAERGDCKAAGWVWPVFGEGVGTEVEYIDWAEFVDEVNRTIGELG